MLYEIHNIFDFNFKLFSYISFRAILSFISALIISFFIGSIIIRTLKFHFISEIIRKNGPESHQKKEGTPTMGGIIILFSVILPTVLFSDISNFYVQITIIATVLMGITGLIDDYLKVVKKYPKGLIARYKILMQIIVGLFVSIMLINKDLENNYFYRSDILNQIDLNYQQRDYVDTEFNFSNTEISIPFLPDKRFSTAKKIEDRVLLANEQKGILNISEKIPNGSLEIGLFLIILTIFVISGSSNAINLTDGLDGLAVGLCATVFFGLGVISYCSGHSSFSSYLNITYISEVGELSIFCMSMLGACLGFLWYNSYPAEIFMGDTGSLALGAAIGTIAVILKKEILLIFMAGVFVIEALSVILQVGFFKYSKIKNGKGKRLFLMAPLHHHFELKGMHESKIVIRFWILGVLLVLLSLITMKVQ
tara:strand:+ start:664 stop:1932 length:1269 start_codon:yes stop_codon:yes gene_type:complete